MTNYVPSQHQHPSSHMMIVMTGEAVQAQITKRYLVAEGMRGSWNMNWLTTCSSVTCTPRNVTVTSLHTGQVIQTVLFLKSLWKLVTGVMVIAEEVAVLQHRLVSDMFIDMLDMDEKCRDGKGPADCEQSFIVWNYKGKLDAQDGVNYQSIKGYALYKQNNRV